MKKYLLMTLAIVALLVTGIGAASAENSLKQGTLGINVDVTNDFFVNGKFFATKDVAILAGFGLGIKGGDGKGTDIGIGAGIRKYLKTTDFAPFVGGSVFYSSTNDSNSKNLALLADFGAEYFLNKQFSIEGSVGFGYTSTEEKTTSTTTGGPLGTPITETTTNKITNIGTQRAGVSVNFYF